MNLHTVVYICRIESPKWTNCRTFIVECTTMLFNVRLCTHWMSTFNKIVAQSTTTKFLSTYTIVAQSTTKFLSNYMIVAQSTTKSLSIYMIVVQSTTSCNPMSYIQRWMYDNWSILDFQYDIYNLVQLSTDSSGVEIHLQYWRLPF